MINQMYNNYLTITIIIEKIFSCNQSPSHRTTSNAYLTTEVLYRNRRPPHPLQRRQDRTTIKVGGKQKPRCKLNSPIERRGYSCFAKESSEREVQVDGQVVSSSSVSWKGALGSTAYIELDPFEQRDALVEKGGAIVRDTEGSKVDTHPPSTASTHPYTIIRRPPARSFFRRRVANQGLDFSLPRLLPPFSLASIANQVRKCARARDAPRPERRAEYLRSLSSYLVLSPCSHRIGMTCSAHKVFLGGDPFRN